jgi:uracil-DNA glycosylase
MMYAPPPLDCSLCPRLRGFHTRNQCEFPAYHNAPVPSFGELSATHLIVGLAPGLHGANQTGRPFTGDYAGDVLYRALLAHGLASGEYGRVAEDGLQLRGVRITNAVRCVPPENKPLTTEIHTCNPFLSAEIAAMPHLHSILVLGLVSHSAVLRACGEKVANYKFAHGAVHRLSNGVRLVCSYHSSRYNINTGRLTEAMFDTVMGVFAGRE